MCHSKKSASVEVLTSTTMAPRGETLSIQACRGQRTCNFSGIPVLRSIGTGRSTLERDTSPSQKKRPPGPGEISVMNMSIRDMVATQPGESIAIASAELDTPDDN